MKYFSRKNLCFSQFTALAAFLVFSTSCGPSKLHDHYARRSYLKTQSEKTLPPAEVPLNQPTREDLRVSTHDYTTDVWEQQPYETINQWSIRLQETLELNQDDFLELKGGYDQLRQEELACLDRMQHMKKLNATMEKALYHRGTSGAGSRSEEGIAIGLNQPFTVHLVAKNETLYSISQKYYGTGTRVNDIMLWNQGWIRSPLNVMAGLTLVLFFDDVRIDKGPNTINSLIRDIQKRSQTPSNP